MPVAPRLWPFVLCLATMPAASAGDLPLKMPRELSFETPEATWASVDVAPDGKTIVFDLLGDIHVMDATGGQARPLLTGPAFESQPVYSPDGDRMAFVSDRGGNENLWVAAADGSDPRPLSKLDDNTEFTSPAWSADGRSVYVSRIRPDVGAFELWLYDIRGGSGLQITEPKSNPQQPKDARLNAVGATTSPDGRHLYYAARAGFFTPGGEFSPWHITRRDLERRGESTVVSVPGGAVRPVISPDGGTLAYATREDGHTAIRLRDLQTGADRELVSPVQHDQQERWATLGLMPRFDFTPDGRYLVFNHAGQFKRVELPTGEVERLDFRADVDMRLGPSLRPDIPVATGPVRARLIQTPTPSPDGSRIAFSALTSLYAMDLKNDEPRRLTPPGMAAFHPSWSTDGKSIVFISWNSTDGGHVWRIPATGGEPERVTEEPAYYTHPVFEPGGDSVLALRSSHYERLRTAMEYGRFRQADLVRLPATDGEPETVATGSFAGPAHFVDGQDRIYIYGSGGLLSVDPDGGDRRVHLKVTGRSYYFQEGRAPVHDIRISPDGKHALAVSWSQVYLLRVPEIGGEAPTINMDQSSVARERITAVGGDFIAWLDGGETIGWALGHTFYTRPLATVTFDGEPADRDTVQRHSEAYPAVVEVPRDIPEGTLVLRGATVITMEGDEVIRDGDVVIENNRIAAVGRRGAVRVPDDAVVRDVSGHYILPGFIDTHAHWADIRRDVLDRQAYGFIANLAYGVTAGLDVSTLTIDMFPYQDMIAAGMIPGLRAFSTGPAVFSFNDFQSKQDALDVLTRYRDHYRVHNVKQYRVGNRRQRQWFAMAAEDLGLLPTTEGADNFKLMLTQVQDGFAGVEHALPVLGLGTDVVRLMAESGVSYSPTLVIADSGPGIDRFIYRTRPHQDPKVKRFFPDFVIDEKTKALTLLRDDGYVYDAHADDARKIAEAGGLVGAGSHGEFQGIGLHWEMQAMAAGGLTPRQVLRIATIGSAEVIGRENDLGSLAPGKLADLVVLEENPLDEIEHTLTLEYVMKNGRLYETETLDELWPRQRRLPKMWFQDD